jgi:O-antigen ligase
MFGPPAIILIVALIYVRPQEFLDSLADFPALYVACAMGLAGTVVDLRRGHSRFVAPPQFLWIVAACLWITATVLIRAPKSIITLASEFGVAVALYFLLAQSVQSFRGLRAIAGAIVLATLFVVGVGIEQGFSTTGCILVDESFPGDNTFGSYDGRPCDTARACYFGEAEPGRQYLCEKVGLFGTSSIQGRIRYRGVLQDPNELALAACIALPLVFALLRKLQPVLRISLSALALMTVVVCLVLTGSRGGVLVFLAVIGVYFLKRFGLKGAALALCVAGPVLLLGGRGGAHAETSTNERLECWYEALMMFKSNPLAGVGYDQFGEYHYLTAHNAYLLTLAELGFLGMLLFSLVVYASAKVPYVVLRCTSAKLALGPKGSVAESLSAGHEPGQAEARAWSLALLGAFAGLIVGIFCLAFAYHSILWLYFGLSAARYASMKRPDGGFSVRLGWRDIALVAFLDLCVIVTVYLATRVLL